MLHALQIKFEIKFIMHVCLAMVNSIFATIFISICIYLLIWIFLDCATCLGIIEEIEHVIKKTIICTSCDANTFFDGT